MDEISKNVRNTDQLTAKMTAARLDSSNEYNPLRIKQLDQSHASLSSKTFTSPYNDVSNDGKSRMGTHSYINQVAQNVSKKQADADISLSDFRSNDNKMRVKRDYSPSVGDIRDYTKQAEDEQ